MKDKVKGSIIGFAIGDAIGMPLEFSKTNNYVSGFEPNKRTGLKAGQYTDDTQHLEIALDSCINCYGRINLGDMSERLINWYKSGKARSIGRTTELAMKNLLEGVEPTKSGIDNLQSCGSIGLSRLVPYLLLSALKPYPEKLTNGDVKRILGVTHAHKKVYRMGNLLSYFIHGVMYDRSPREINNMILFENEFLNKDMRKKLKFIKELSESDKDPLDSIKKIGDSGFVEDVLFSAIYSSLKYDNFKDAVLCSANGKGDSDSRAAITGAISGLYKGYEAIPKEWVTKLERSSELEEKAENIYYLK